MAYKVKKNGKTTWVALVRVQGERRCKVGFHTKQEALHAEAKFRDEIQARLQTKTHTDCLRLIDWANRYLTYSKTKFSETWYAEKRAVFRRFFRQIDPELSPELLTASECLSYLQEQAETRTGSAANSDRKNLIAAWNWGRKFMGLPEKNPFIQVDKFAEQRRPRYVPPEEDFWAVYQAATSEQDQVMLLTFLHTAARRSEVLRLTWDDIDFAHGKLRLGTRKRKDGSFEYDWIPLTTELTRALLKHKQGSTGISVFVREGGRPYKFRQHWLRYLCGVANVRYFGLHAIRHLTASILAHAGEDIPTIQAILRHKSPNTTARYLHQIGCVKNSLERVFGQRGKVIPFRKQEAPEAVTSRAQNAG